MKAYITERSGQVYTYEFPAESATFETKNGIVDLYYTTEGKRRYIACHKQDRVASYSYCKPTISKAAK